MKYGKLICGALHVPQNYPCAIKVNGEKITNPTEEQLIAAGYMPIVEADKPAAKEGFEYVATYKVMKGKIKQSWEECKVEEMSYDVDE